MPLYETISVITLPLLIIKDHIGQSERLATSHGKSRCLPAFVSQAIKALRKRNRFYFCTGYRQQICL